MLFEKRLHGVRLKFKYFKVLAGFHGSVLAKSKYLYSYLVKQLQNIQILNGKLSLHERFTSENVRESGEILLKFLSMNSIKILESVPHGNTLRYEHKMVNII
jgi:hypothetical protein